MLAIFLLDVQVSFFVRENQQPLSAIYMPINYAFINNYMYYHLREADSEDPLDIINEHSPYIFNHSTTFVK